MRRLARIKPVAVTQSEVARAAGGRRRRAPGPASPLFRWGKKKKEMRGEREPVGPACQRPSDWAQCVKWKRISAVYVFGCLKAYFFAALV
jgi:hypothetical protein